MGRLDGGRGYWQMGMGYCGKGRDVDGTFIMIAGTNLSEKITL